MYPHQQLLPNGAADQTPPSAAAAADFPGAGDPPTIKKVKFLCSFGGRILPRPTDGALRYVGGHTRIVALRRDASFQELLLKMADVYGNTAVIKYQLPDEDLDALVSVSCPEDLENMMEEYDKLAESSPEGSAKLRVFLFSPADLDMPGSSQAPDLHDTGQRYMDAVNGISEPGTAGMRRKESVASLSSTQNSDGVAGEVADSTTEGMSPAITSPTVAAAAVAAASQDASRLMFVETPPNPVVDGQRSACVPPPQTLASSRLEQPPPPPAAAAYVPHTYVDSLQEGFNRVNYLHHPSKIQYVNPQQLGFAGAPVGLVAFPQHSFVSGLHTTNAMPPAEVSSVKPIQTKADPYLEDNSYGGRVAQLSTDPSYRPYQPLSQLPPLPPSSLQAQNVERYGWHQMLPPLVPPGQTLKLEDCIMCQKSLPHAHSDTFTKEHGGSGSTASVPEISPVFHSLHPEDVMRLQAPHGVVTGVSPDGMVEHRVQGSFTAPHLGSLRYSLVPEAQKHDIDKVGPQKTENLDQTRGMHPQSANLTGTPQASYEMYLSCHPQAPHEDTLQQQPPPLAAHQYLVKQDAVINNPMVSGVSPMSGAFQNLESPIKDSVAEFSYDHVKPIEGMIEKLHVGPSETSVVTEQWKPAIKPHLTVSGHIEGGKMEVLRTSPSQTSGISEQWRVVAKPNISASKDLKTESSPLVKETGENVKPEEKGREKLLGNTFASPGALPEMSYFKAVDQLPSSTLDVTRLQNLQHPDSIQVSQALGNLGLYLHHFELGIEPPVYHEQLPGVPSTTLKNPVGDWKDEASQFYPVNAFSGISAPLNSNLPFPNLANTNWHNRDIQQPVPSESLFSNMEPWQIMQNTHLPPPMPRRVASRETVIPRDSCIENCSRNGGESRVTVRTEEGGSHQPSDPLNKDTLLDPIRPMGDSAEQLIKQDLQSVAEGVASSVLQPSIPSVPGFYARETSESVHEFHNDMRVGEDNVYSQSVISPEDQKSEDIKIAQTEKINIGFQTTEDLGHLQIIKNSDLEELRELGSGTFGTVYHGKWRGSDVAIKRINDRCFVGKQSEQERMRADFWNEACKLADLHHPNVVAFYGIVLDGPGESIATVTEYMVNGSLRNVLQRNDKMLDRRKCLLIAMDVAFGMEYLHGKNIVHFDLKSDNLLVNLRDPQRPICKVGDLGLSKVKCQTLISGGVRGTLPWMAPELLSGSSNLVSEKVDVFSFGIVMWEILTGEEPYGDLHYGAIIGGIVSNTLRPPIPESCDPEWRLLMEKCWSSEPCERPSFMEIASKLRSMAASVPNKGQAS